jgi:cobalt-zinc-cadmium efflux system protein
MSNQEHATVRMDNRAPRDYGLAFAVGIILNLAFVVLEVVFGLLADSLALVADAGHNLSDVLGLGLAWGASMLSRIAATERRTYGLRSSSILAALFNAILLLISVGAIAWEAIKRFKTPVEVAGTAIIWVALVGIVINAATGMMFMSGRKYDLNVRGAFLHMAADTAISAGVVVAGFVIVLTGWHLIDPVVSLLICGVIVWGTWDLLRESVNLALQAVPANIDLAKVREYLASVPQVREVHDLHVWAISTTQTALTAHLVIPTGASGDTLLHEVCEHLQREFGIEHATVQVEQNAELCSLGPDRIICAPGDRSCVKSRRNAAD